MVRQCDPGEGGDARMIVVYAFTVFIFAYLIYALLHPEKF